jgi:hypothetical protein
MKSMIIMTAEAVLASFPKPYGAFGSDAQLEHDLYMVKKWGGDQNVRSCVSALARIARQKDITKGDAPFVWDDAECTHHIDWTACQSMCEALRRSAAAQGVLAAG